MFHMPMSSPMMTTMLGFCCCADAGTLAAVMAMSEASTPIQTFLVKLMGWFPAWLPGRGRQLAPWYSVVRAKGSTLKDGRRVFEAHLIRRARSEHIDLDQRPLDTCERPRQSSFMLFLVDKNVRTLRFGFLFCVWRVAHPEDTGVPPVADLAHKWLIAFSRRESACWRRKARAMISGR